MVAMPVFAPLTTVDERPTHDHWCRLVGMFSGAVGRGRIDKVVLARRVDLRSPVELDVPNALRRLAASAPESTTYAFRRGGRTFLGATPERLVRTEGRTFRTVAVAGTIRRGADAAEDERLGRALLASEKDREEHAVVVSSIRDLLGPVADSLTVAPEPGVMTLRFVQHLVTEISGTVPDAHGLLALGERLHPTPAVGGEPRDVALALLDEHEGFDRGWYAGPVGWLGADGDGELCVALRCGIVDRTQATLFAGCGIVADSDPDLEWEESRIKLRAVISALGIPEDER
jgi:isochorismate synthase